MEDTVYTKLPHDLFYACETHLLQKKPPRQEESKSFFLYDICKI